MFCATSSKSSAASSVAAGFMTWRSAPPQQGGGGDVALVEEGVGVLGGRAHERAVLSASSASCQVSIELLTWKPPMTRPTITGMSRIAFSRVGTRQLRGEKRPPLGGAAAAPDRTQGRAPLRAAAG